MERKYTQGYVVKHRSKWRAIVNWQDDNGKQHRLTKSTGITCHPDKVDPSTGKTVPDKGNSRRSMYCQNTGDLKKTCPRTDVLGCSRQVIEIGPFETRHVLPNAGDSERYRKNGAPAQADALLRKPIAATTLSSRTGGITTVLEVVLGDQLVVVGEAVGGEHGEDPRGHDDAEVVVEAGDGVLGGVDDDVVLIAGHAADEEGADALVEGAALVLTHEQEHRDAGLEQLERAVEEVVRGDVADALPLHLLEQAHGVQDGLVPQRARADEHGVVGQRVLPGELLGARLEALAGVEHALPDVLCLLDEQVELREAAATVEEAGLLTPTRGPNGYRRYVSADIDHIEKGTHMDNKEKYEGMKREPVEDNERTYGQKVRERWGDAVADGANRKTLNLSKDQFARFQELGRRINEELEDAVRAGADPTGPAGAHLCALHKEWLDYTWSFYSPEAHKGLAEIYVADERFTSYYDEVVKGCAAWLRDAVIAHTR